MTLANYVKLEADIEKVLRIKQGSFHIEPRTITDPVTKDQKIVNAAVMTVIEEDGKAIDKTFSTLSDKLASTLRVSHENGNLYRYRVGIKPVGEGYAREYQVRLF